MDAEPQRVIDLRSPEQIAADAAHAQLYIDVATADVVYADAPTGHVRRSRRTRPEVRRIPTRELEEELARRQQRRDDRDTQRARSAAASARRDEELEAARQARRSELAARPRNPCPGCGRLTPLARCRRCSTGCQCCGHLTTLRDPVGVPLCESCQWGTLVTATQAHTEWGITAARLAGLRHVLRTRHTGPRVQYRLYLRADIETLATAPSTSPELGDTIDPRDST